MKILHLSIILGITMMIILGSYVITLGFSNSAKSSCTDPTQADLQNDTKSLSTRKQIESIVLSYPATKKLIDNNTHCEVMSISTLYTADGTYPIVNINLNNTNNLVAQVSLQNSSVVSYHLYNLTRSATAVVKPSMLHGITALIIYHPPDVCLSSSSHSTPSGLPICPPNKFYLKINSNSTAYLVGYNICDGNSCAMNNTMSLTLPLNIDLNPNYQMIGLPVDLPWKYGDMVRIQLYVSPTNDNKTASLVDLGDSKIVP